jgi:hypothetical protein
MSKQAAGISKDQLIKILKQAEAAGATGSKNQLFAKAAEIYNKDADQPITSTVVYLRVKQWAIPCLQIVPQKGPRIVGQLRVRPAGEPPPVAAVVKADKARSLSLAEAIKEELENAAKYLSSVIKVFQRAFSGNSKSAALKAKCIQCCCYQKAEVSKCTVKGCALWQYRPYQRGEDEEDAGDDQEDTASK